MRFTVITIFPEMLSAFARAGIVRRALDSQLIQLELLNPRDFTTDARRTVDDTPYGGGPGMVMSVPPLRAAIARAREFEPRDAHVAYLSPQGRRIAHDTLPELARHSHLILLAGRYEGIDERLLQRDVDSEWSLGDFVLSGGEIPAMAVIDALTRLLPGALGDERSAQEDSFVDHLLDHPHYTRPEVVDGQEIPAVLKSGNHQAIARWRRQQALGRTWSRRPDLLAALPLSREDQNLLEAYLESGDAGSQAKQS